MDIKIKDEKVTVVIYDGDNEDLAERAYNNGMSDLRSSEKKVIDRIFDGKKYKMTDRASYRYQVTYSEWLYEVTIVLELDRSEQELKDVINEAKHALNFLDTAYSASKTDGSVLVDGRSLRSAGDTLLKMMKIVNEYLIATYAIHGDGEVKSRLIEKLNDMTPVYFDPDAVVLEQAHELLTALMTHKPAMMTYATVNKTVDILSLLIKIIERYRGDK